MLVWEWSCWRGWRLWWNFIICDKNHIIMWHRLGPVLINKTSSTPIFSFFRMRGCSLSKLGCDWLASAFKSNPFHLRELHLSGNQDLEVEQLSCLLRSPDCKLKTLRSVHCVVTHLTVKVSIVNCRNIILFIIYIFYIFIYVYIHIFGWWWNIKHKVNLTIVEIDQ